MSNPPFHYSPDTRTRARFEKLQTQIRALDAQKNDLAIDLRVKYGDVRYAKTSERKRLDMLDARISRLADKVFAILDRVSPRDWRSGVPWHWIITELSYDDATTREQMAVVPPAAYGYTDRDARQFAAAVR